jgi:hypothetical protein
MSKEIADIVESVKGRFNDCCLAMSHYQLLRPSALGSDSSIPGTGYIDDPEVDLWLSWS